jgi:hypothetical protein
VKTASSGLTVSIGVAAPAEPVDFSSAFDVLEELLAIAMAAMFEARAAGGDQGLRHIHG